MTTLQNRTNLYNTATHCNCSKSSFSDIILEHDVPFQSLEQPKPLYFSINYDSCDRCEYFQDDPIDKRYGCPVSQFMDDVYSQFVLKNPDKPTIIDFINNSDYLSSIPHNDKQWLSIQQHLSKYTKTISKPIHPNLFDLIEYESNQYDAKNLMQKYENTQHRILHYTSQIAPTYLRNLAKTFDPKTPHQLDVFFIPKIVDKINSNYFKKHNITNFVRCKWTQQDSISIVEYGGKTCFAGYDQPDIQQEISSMYLLLRQLYQTHKSKRYVMLIMSRDIHNISMDEICIFEPPNYNTLPPYPKHIYNELQWIHNTKQSLPDIPWDTLHAVCISFHEHEDAERVYFSTMLPNNSYHSTRLFKSNILDVLAPFCKDRTDTIPDWYHGWLEFNDPKYTHFVDTYFYDLKLFDCKIESKKPVDKYNDGTLQQNAINEAISQKTMDEYQQINHLIDEYYKSLDVKYNDKFIQYIFDNEFEDVPLEDNLGSDIDPKDCTLLHFDHLFAIHPHFNINNEDELHEYIFYFLQYCYFNGKFPTPQYMSKKVPRLLCDDHTNIQGTMDEIIAITQFTKIAKNIITNPTECHKVDLDNNKIIKQFSKIDKFISLLHSSGFSNFSDETTEYNHVYTFDTKNRNSWNKFEKAVNQLHNNINVLSSDYLMTCIYYTMSQNQPNIISVFAGNNGTATSVSTGSGNSNHGGNGNQPSTNRNDTGQNNNNNNHTNNNNSGDDGKDNDDNNKKNKPHKTNIVKKKKKRKKKKNNNDKEIETAVNELYHYMDKTQALQIGKNEFDTKNHEKIKIINYDFHEKKTEIPLYCVAKPSNDRGYKWKLENRMFTVNDLFKEYGITKNEIPRTLRTKFMSEKNISEPIKQIIEDEKQFIRKINKMPWHKIPVFKKSNNSLMMRLEMSKKELIDNIIQFIKNKNNKSNTLIPILMFNSNTDKCYIDYVWIVKLPKVDINIGISLNYNHKTKNIEPTAIHLDKQSILRQHKLAYPSHECHCLDNFKNAEIPLDLSISSQYIHEQHTNASKNLLQELLSANFEINNKWKQKVLNLLNNNDKNKHNTSYDPPSENRADGIIQIPRRFRRNIISKIKELFGPMPKTHLQPNYANVMTDKLQTKNAAIDPKNSIQQSNIPMNNTQNVSINSKIITPQPTIGHINYNGSVPQQPNITPFAPPNLTSIPMQPIQKTTPVFNITPYYPVTMLMPAIPNTINTNITGQSLNPSTYTKYYPPILMPCSYIPINNQYPRFPVLYPPILLNTVQ
eukprot:321218_1